MTKEGMCSRRKKIAIFVFIASIRSVNKDIRLQTNQIILKTNRKITGNHFRKYFDEHFPSVGLIHSSFYSTTKISGNFY